MFSFMEEIIQELRQCGRIRTSETYGSALSSFSRFRNGADLPLNAMTPSLLASYESYLSCARGLSPNSTSFYMRILRAVYNRAVDRGLTEQKYPFKTVYTGVGRTRKRAISMPLLRRISRLPLAKGSPLDFARDMFLFSFYTRGMPFVDMAYLRRSDLSHGMLEYRRRKTGQLLRVRWETCMQQLLDKYPLRPETGYLLPIITDAHADQRRQYILASHKVNRNLKSVGQMAGAEQPLSMYVARHTWATAARNRHIPLSVISDGLGHDSENTTRIYLDSIDNAEIDKANRLILNALWK